MRMSATSSRAAKSSCPEALPSCATMRASGKPILESASGLQTPAGPIDPALEREYNLRLRHPERTAIYERFAQSSADFRAEASGWSELRYGEGPRCVLDFFPANVAS